MRTTSIGKSAESVVAVKLKTDGYVIIGRNWRTKVCEIDIIARKKGVIYFVEVKYRSQDAQGTGFEYITPAKMRKMEFAAGIWTVQNSWDGDYRLMAASVAGERYDQIETLEL